ncbi:hypothetical protein [Sphingobium sp. D43FB]|uniref:hypothetical protein n=1 Tax=Sphingobium sp. D43FB TaxID=2017595 RepID=UPI000BB52D2E|nr:hypothetical protein [Sphingobium sp. D43FB]PBN45366.1 hypothetical protein SxD43FB_00430 [Sphingobium sp. D43FB]
MSDAADYRALTTLQALPNLSTVSMFDPTPLGRESSPIDLFIASTDEINQLYLQYIGGGIPAPLGSLVLLGYTSAVESYVRAVIRRTVLGDAISGSRAALQTLPYGAAYHHAKDRLPEALLESYSFSSPKNITDALKEVLGIDVKGSEMQAVMDDFARICELRHCCVHRGGRLGSRNAIRLGLDAHGQLLERPFRPSIDDLQGIADTLRTFVKTLNNFLFATVLERTVRHGGATVPDVPWTWKWSWSEDRPYFTRYYQIFSSQADVPQSPTVRRAYASFAANVKPGGPYWLNARTARRLANAAAQAAVPTEAVTGTMPVELAQSDPSSAA